MDEEYLKHESLQKVKMCDNKKAEEICDCLG